MSEMTHEDALRQADSLVGDALKETEARCGVLAQVINDYQGSGPKTSALTDAVRELRALQDHRSGLLRRRSLIQQALDVEVGESPAAASLPPPPTRTAPRIQQQVQIQARARRQR